MGKCTGLKITWLLIVCVLRAPVCCVFCLPFFARALFLFIVCTWIFRFFFYFVWNRNLDWIHTVEDMVNGNVMRAFSCNRNPTTGELQWMSETHNHFHKKRLKNTCWQQNWNVQLYHYLKIHWNCLIFVLFLFLVFCVFLFFFGRIVFPLDPSISEITPTGLFFN